MIVDGFRVHTTYYFTQHLLPRLLPIGDESQPESSEILEEIADFVAQFGSYLRLHTCLAYAAVLKAPRLVDSLLEVAKFDPRHREVMKQTSRPTALVIYDSVSAPNSVSAVVAKRNYSHSRPFGSDNAVGRDAAIKRYSSREKP